MPFVDVCNSLLSTMKSLSTFKINTGTPPITIGKKVLAVVCNQPSPISRPATKDPHGEIADW
jgi:hypothetical protein